MYIVSCACAPNFSSLRFKVFAQLAEEDALGRLVPLRRFPGGRKLEINFFFNRFSRFWYRLFQNKNLFRLVPNSLKSVQPFL